jgi:hypothetical protein
MLTQEEYNFVNHLKYFFMKQFILTLLYLVIISFVNAQLPSYVPSNGLIGWWPFNGDANDLSVNGNHGTVNGPVLIADRCGNQQRAYYFDGLDDIITANPNLPTGSAPRTITSWFNTSASFIPSSQFPNMQHIVGWGNPLSGPIIFNQWVMAPSGGAYFESGSSGNIMSSTSIVNNGNWHFFALTYNGAQSKVYMYIDGVLEDSTANVTLNTAQSFLGIGNCPFANTPFLGMIDDIGIWNRQLNNFEILNLYNAQLGSPAISAGLDQSICAGDNVTLNGAGGSNYQWNNNVVDGQAFAPTQSDAYVVTGQDTLGCTGTDTVVVTVLENSSSTLTQTALDSYTLNGQTYTQSGTYTQTLTAANGCDSTITLNLTLNFTGLDELGTVAKKLVKITDLNGKIIPRRKNTLMLFIYEDGTVERVVEMEE